MKQPDATITTRTLMRRLLKTSTFDRFRARYQDDMNAPTLSSYLKRLCEERGETHESVIKRASLDRVYGHQIFSGLRLPARDKVLQLAFGFGMDVEEAQALLKVAQQSALYPRIERDAAISFCLHKRMSFTEAQIMLSELQLPLMGRERGHEQ